MKPPKCLGPVRYACFTIVCSCAGKPIGGCKEFDEPYSDAWLYRVNDAASFDVTDFRCDAWWDGGAD
ncbi:MAG: hypothetical protein U0235_07045 [Polyangiaceae bacterium]